MNRITFKCDDVEVSVGELLHITNNGDEAIDVDVHNDLKARCDGHGVVVSGRAISDWGETMTITARRVSKKMAPVADNDEDA